MAYNYKYKMEWKGLKNPDESFYYRLEFYKSEDNEIIYTPETIKASSSPFVLKYISKEDFAYEPLKPSSAEITIFLDENSEVQPEEFYSDTENTTYKVILRLIDGDTDPALWTGFILSGDVQYDWQERYYLRLTATDNLAVLKEYKYSQSDRFGMFETQDVYSGISLKDFVIRCLNFIGLELDVKFCYEMYQEEVSKNELTMFLSEYSAIDWEKRYPFDVYDILSKLMTTLGCILYQDNRDSTWTILNVNYAITIGASAIPFRLYDKDGNALSSGDLDISGRIERNGDFRWSDRNQIVTLNKRLDEVRIVIKNRFKNLVRNYGFFQGDINDAADFWVDVSLSTPTDVIRYIPNPYDDRALSFQNSRVLASYDNSKYCYQTMPLNKFNAFFNGDTGYKLLPDSYKLYLQYDYQFAGTSANIFYSQVSLGFNRPADSKFLTVNKDGEWFTFNSLNETLPINVERKDTSTLQQFKLLTKGTIGGLSLTPSSTNWFNQLAESYILIRPIAVGVVGSDSLILDNFILNLIPSSVTGKNIVYYATQTTPYYITNNNIPAYRINVKEINSMYTGGYYGSESAAYFEDCIMTKYEDDFENIFLDASRLWVRHWQDKNENTYNYLDALTCASILSFYKYTGKKFTGNVYAEQTPAIGTPFAFPMYLEVEGTQNTNSLTTQYNIFQRDVLLDSGIVEDTDCGADFLGEFYDTAAKFLMVSAEFDYRTSKTLVNLHQDFTDTTELAFDIGTLGFQGGSLDPKFTQIGSSSGDVQEEVLDG